MVHLRLLFGQWHLGPVWYICLKTKNCCLKIFVEIRVGKKSVWKYVKYCLKTENCCLETLTKHPLSLSFIILFFCGVIRLLFSRLKYYIIFIFKCFPLLFLFLFFKCLSLLFITTAHPWRNDHSTSISVYGMWGVKVKVQVSRRKFHTHIHLD